MDAAPPPPPPSVSDPEPELVRTHRGELPPSENSFDKFYVPRVLPEGEKLPPSDHDPLPVPEYLKPRVAKIVDTLAAPPSGLAVMFLGGINERYAASNFEGYHDIAEDNPVEFYEMLQRREMFRGDVLFLGLRGTRLYYRLRPRPNIYNDPLKRREYVKVLQDLEEQMIKDNLKKDKGSHEKRLFRIEQAMSKMAVIANALEGQNQAIQQLLKMHSREKYNGDLIQALRENIANHEREILTLNTRISDLEAESRLCALVRDAQRRSTIVSLPPPSSTLAEVPAPPQPDAPLRLPLQPPSEPEPLAALP